MGRRITASEECSQAVRKRPRKRLSCKSRASISTRSCSSWGKRVAPTRCLALGNAELRAILPQLWRAFHEGDSASDVAQVQMSQFRAWLRKLKNPGSRWGWATDAALRKVLTDVQKQSCVRRSMGFRFKDPSKSGSWSANNLVGYTERPLRQLLRKGVETEVTWHSYAAAFRLRAITKDALEVQRTLQRKVISTRIEKRRRGDQSGPLATAGSLVTVTAYSRCAPAWDRRKRIRIERRAADLLPAVIMRPITPHRWTLIYLHGLGSSALTNYADRPHYFFDGSNAIKVVIPTAPSREVSCFDGWWIKTKAPKQQEKRWRLTKFLSWYDYISNHDGRREDDIDFNSLHVVQEALHSVIWNEALELGGQTHKVILGGKSQGCCTALDAALTFPSKLGGFIGIVGHLLGCTPADAAGPQVTTPFYFFHELEDTMMRWSWVQRGEQRLREAGYHIHTRHCLDPERHGHFIEGVEGSWIRQALRSICSA